MQGVCDSISSGFLDSLAHIFVCVLAPFKKNTWYENNNKWYWKFVNHTQPYLMSSWKKFLQVATKCACKTNAKIQLVTNMRAQIETTQRTCTSCNFSGYDWDLQRSRGKSPDVFRKTCEFLCSLWWRIVHVRRPLLRTDLVVMPTLGAAVHDCLLPCFAFHAAMASGVCYSYPILSKIVQTTKKRKKQDVPTSLTFSTRRTLYRSNQTRDLEFD